LSYSNKKITCNPPSPKLGLHVIARRVFLHEILYHVGHFFSTYTKECFYYDKKERYLLLPKENIKKEFGFSPDLADALALTFFDPLPAKINTINYDDGGAW